MSYIKNEVGYNNSDTVGGLASGTGLILDIFPKKNKIFAIDIS
jgi:hypothetical protein